MNENFNRDNWCAPSVSELAKDLEEAVKDLWEHRNEGGCCHWPIYYEDNGKEWDVALGWAEGYEEDPNIYYDEGYAICASVRYQTAHNAMQTDLNIDFLMPCYEGGDCWDTDCTISKEEDYTYLAKYLLDEGKKMVEAFADKDVEDDEDMDESRLRRGRSLRESRRPRSRMLKESRIDWSRMPTIPQEQIDAVEGEIRQKYNTWDERTQESADMVLNALDCVNDEIESCKANKDLGEDLELIVNVIRGGGYSEISLLDLDNEIDASALEDFIADVLENQEFGVDEIDFDKETSTPFKRGLRRYSAEEEATRLNRDVADRGLRKHYTFGPFEESRRPRGRMLREGRRPIRRFRKR